MWSIYLTKTGPNRKQLIVLIRDLIKKSLSEAKQLVDSQRPLIAHGDHHEIARIRNALRNAGASVEIDFYPEGIDASNWVPEDYSHDKETCSNCGKRLFFVIPGRTSEEEVVAFRTQAGLPPTLGDEGIRWMHPGVYCPSDCFSIFVNFGDPFMIA